MNTIEISVLSALAASRAFADAWHEGEAGRETGSKLALSLGCDYKNLHRDVTDLVEVGLLDRADDGALLAPYDEILIHAGIRDAA